MGSELITIRQASKLIGVSFDTLRRLDKAKKLLPVRRKKTGHRYYRKKDIENYNIKNLFKLAKLWIKDNSGFEPRYDFYSPDSFIFKSRLIRMENDLKKTKGLDSIYSLISAISGEIGNNSFDHNLGNWPDIPGIFFAYNLNKKIVVLADRGLGILATLRNIKPKLASHQEALYVAFTKIISGRTPESRGNGLKFVRDVVMNNKIGLFFQTGNAYLKIMKSKTKNQNHNFEIKKSNINFHGCLALIKF